MKQRLIIIALFILLITGCSAKDTMEVTKTFEIALSSDQVLNLVIPDDWELTEQDAFHYWQFNDKICIYRNKAKATLGKSKGKCIYNQDSVARNFSECSITIEGDKSLVSTFGQILEDAYVETREVLTYKERLLNELPGFTEYAMDLTTNGLYMPVDYNEVTSDVYTACHSINHKDYVTCWIMNYKLTDLKVILNTLVTCNENGKLDQWFQNDDIYYAVAGDHYVGAKRLTYNKWVCYLSNKGFSDYLLKALYVVKPEE